MPEAKVISQPVCGVVMDKDETTMFHTTASSKHAHSGRVHAIPVRPSEANPRLTSEAVYRFFDIALASVGLIVALPLMLATAVVIRVNSPGPVLFLHRRPARSIRVLGRDLEGRNDLRPPPGGFNPDVQYWVPTYFTLLKFRTMYADARARFPSYFPDVYAKEDFRCRFPHVENDPRITRVGRVLRKLSVDELPNLWSVLVGDMSLVGPRPEAPEVLQYHTPEEMIKFTLKPGVTGLSQIRGRKLLTWGQMLALDLQYVRTRSMALDFKIVLLTIRQVITAHGAL